MLGIILRSVFIIGVVFQYSLSVFNTVDKYFTEQFKKQNDMHLNRSKNIPEDITDASSNKNITSTSISNHSNQRNCVKLSYFDYFINYCPAVQF